ncbi:MAG: hypothetical protein IT384_30390 [Deltaproteobacteria bacterium]|nr:hypothetical protein [Deltaproteobacteria bacterium]
MGPTARARGLGGAVLAGALTLLACGGEEDPCAGGRCEADGGDDAGLAADGNGDAALPDAEPIDTGPPDLGTPDIGSVLRSSTCFDCVTGCPEGLCVTKDREQFCLDSCATDREACLAGFSCIDIDADPGREALVCVPPAAICDQIGVGFGTPCYGDLAFCTFDRNTCQGDVLGMGYCTDACADDRTCPPGYRCGLGDDGTQACLARFGAPAEHCARESEPTEPPCLWDADCVPGSACVDSGPGQPGVCAAPCAAGACDPGLSCRPLRDGRDACLPERCLCRARFTDPDVRDLLGEALAQLGLDRCRAGYEIAELVGAPPDVLFDPYRLSLYHALHDEPWRAPGWAREVAGELDAAAATGGAIAGAAEMIAEAASLADRPAVRHPPDPPDAIAPLTAAVAAFIESAGGQPDRDAITLDAADVPMDLQLSVAIVVEGARQALLARRAALGGVAAAALQQLYDYGPAFVARRADGYGLAPANRAVRVMLTDTIRYGELYGGAVDLLEAIDRADLARFRQLAGTTTVATATATLIFSQETPAGRIAIGDGDNGLYDERRPGFEGAFAVLVDLGGHDTYRVAAGGNVASTNPVSVLIDLGGRDQYGYVEAPDPLDGARLPADAFGRFHPTQPDQGGPVSLSEAPRQGGARLGIAALIDLDLDDDVYRSLRMSQGAGLFGAGMLIDEGGDDTYVAEAVAQGAGAFGIGLLFDAAGNDTRSAYTMAQGFAFAASVGLSYDLAGDDQYLLDVGDPAIGGDPLYPSAQRPTSSNASLGQGCGFGRRADFSDRAFMSGGVGALVDAAGDDTYRASVFAQGAGFWFGTGLLADERGSDHYDGMWYAMGAGAHYALGLLLEGAGDDAYGTVLPRLNVTIAGGHDFSTAMVIDESGSDVYRGSRITLGAGNASGAAFFVDNGGDDDYALLSSYGLGSAGLLDAELAAPGSARRKVDTLGIFIDAGGRDLYREADQTPEDARDDARWLRGQSTDPAVRATERGSGADGTGDSTLHARWP